MSNIEDNKLAVFQGKHIRKVFHEGEWWFVITDIISALTDAADPSDYWKKMRKRDPDLGKTLQGGGQFVPPLALEFATAGGNQKLQCWNTEGIFRLIQSIPSPKAEPFKRWLARVGKEIQVTYSSPPILGGDLGVVKGSGKWRQNFLFLQTTPAPP
ncbi:MAG: Bro-N domain-containing protein [Thermodesulfovibrionales bacterium]